MRVKKSGQPFANGELVNSGNSAPLIVDSADIEALSPMAQFNVAKYYEADPRKPSNFDFKRPVQSFVNRSTPVLVTDPSTFTEENSTITNVDDIDNKIINGLQNRQKRRKMKRVDKFILLLVGIIFSIIQTPVICFAIFMYVKIVWLKI